MTDETQQQAAPGAARDDGWEWMFVEIMGHRSHWGRTREEERFGAKMLRVDVPRVVTCERAGDGSAVKLDPPRVEWATRYYGGASIFSITLTDEATVMARNTPYQPPARLSLPSPQDLDDAAIDFEQHDEDLSL
jgi:hypothetical protein